MKARVFIVAPPKCPLLKLAMASFDTFAPTVQVNVQHPGVSDQPHADTIQRMRRCAWDVDLAILFDSDAMVCSPRWWPTLVHRFEQGASVVGGFRSRGDASQMFIDGVPIMHASMLAMRRDVFEKTSSFRSEHDPVTGYTQLDTAARVSLEAHERGEVVSVIPFYRVGHGPRFPGLQVGEYFDTPGETLWAHCWRGTSMAHQTPWQWARHQVGRLVGSPHARTWQEAQRRRAEYLRIGWEIVKGA